MSHNGFRSGAVKDYRIKVAGCHGETVAVLEALTVDEHKLLTRLAAALNEFSANTDAPDCHPTMRIIRLYTDIAEGTFARIQVADGAASQFPIVERVDDGWQSGVHRYVDDDVIAVAVLELTTPAVQAST